MVDPVLKQQLLEQFSAYLDAGPGENADDDGGVDLCRLLTELSALKAEVKIESRQVKAAIDEFQGLMDLLRGNNEQLSAELSARHQEEAAQREKTERPLLLALLDLRDRLEAGVTQAGAYRPGWLASFDGRAVRHIQTLQQGMEISLRRLDGLLARYDVKPIEAMGQPLDPHCMQVSATEQQAGQQNGVVLAEVRKGYRRREQLLRLAEVVVNKKDGA